MRHVKTNSFRLVFVRMFFNFPGDIKRGLTAEQILAKKRRQLRLQKSAAPQNGPGGQGVQLDETAAVDMAIDVHIKEPDDRTRGMQYIIILYDVRIIFFI